jgi:hypothetical protein
MRGRRTVLKDHGNNYEVKVRRVGPSRAQTCNLQMLPGRQTQMATRQIERRGFLVWTDVAIVRLFPSAVLTITLSTAKNGS